jgi:hypothetical protein
MLREFDRRLVAQPTSAVVGERDIQSRDESTAAMLYFRTDPAGHGSFGPNARYIKLTADVGGGTTDVAAYASGKILFHNSILLGGRDLVGEPTIDAPSAGIFSRVYDWARSRHLPPSLERIIAAYPSHHTKFTYLVRHPWFHERRGVLSAEPWFPAVQACILYFYGALHFNIGLRLRAISGEEVQPPDFIFFGGNGSTYLQWLTEFQPWNSAPARPNFSRLFQGILEVGYGRQLAAPLEVLTSTKPKHEVALGLLEQGIPVAGHQNATDVPVGEEVALRRDSAVLGPFLPESTLLSDDLSAVGVPNLRFTRPFAEREISRFNARFVDEISALASGVDPQWRQMARRIRDVFESLDERFFENQITNALQAHLARDDIGAVTLLVLEATATLRHLEQQIVREI